MLALAVVALLAQDVPADVVGWADTVGRLAVFPFSLLVGYGIYKAFRSGLVMLTAHHRDVLAMRAEKDAADAAASKALLEAAEQRRIAEQTAAGAALSEMTRQRDFWQGMFADAAAAGGALARAGGTGKAK